jgi:chromate transporter
MTVASRVPASTPTPSLLRTVLPLVLRASTVHIGGIATQAWLRTVLVDDGRMSADDFNRCFAVGRLTPGTNLLAFYAALGYHVARWRGTLACLAVSTLVPACIAATLGVLYVRYASVSGVDRFMAGAQAGALAVLFWTSASLLTATTAERPARGAVLGLGALLAVWSGLLPPVVILLAAAAAGAVFLGGDR